MQEFGANLICVEDGIASERIIDGILNAAEKLGDFPENHPLLDDELLCRLGLRMTRFDNYNIFYYYNEQQDMVYIIRILRYKLY